MCWVKTGHPEIFIGSQPRMIQFLFVSLSFCIPIIKYTLFSLKSSILIPIVSFLQILSNSLAFRLLLSVCNMDRSALTVICSYIFRYGLESNHIHEKYLILIG